MFLKHARNIRNVTHWLETLKHISYHRDVRPVKGEVLNTSEIVQPDVEEDFRVGEACLEGVQLLGDFELGRISERKARS